LIYSVLFLGKNWNFLPEIFKKKEKIEFVELGSSFCMQNFGVYNIANANVGLAFDKQRNKPWQLALAKTN